MGPRLIFIVFSWICFSFLNLPARLAGTRQRRVFVESHSAVPLAFRHKMAGCARKSHIFTEFLLLFYFFIWYIEC